MENQMKTYQITVYSTVTKLHTVNASSREEAIECANDIMSPLEEGDAGSDRHWEQTVVEAKEIPRQRELTLEEGAFVDAYCRSVAVATREEVVRFMATDSEYRSSREFYDSMSDVYTSIMDAKEIWYFATNFAKEQNK